MTTLHFIPLLTTQAGSCLTSKNWQEVGVSCVSYSLMSLLIKPGLNTLCTLPDWKKYAGWSKDWVLNASMEKAPIEEKYAFRSPYDGARLSCSFDDIVKIILHLQPTMVILPKGFHVVDKLSDLAKTSALFVPANEVSHYPMHLIRGIYYDAQNTSESLEIIRQHSQQFSAYQCYLSGPLDESFRSAIVDLSMAVFVESDLPALDACSGVVYSQGTSIDLKDAQYEKQFESIAPGCLCPTCKQNFTRAYLYHLLQQTPLLCQRLLIQHNIHTVIF